MGKFETVEIEAAFEEYRRRAEEQEDWAHWAALFTDDAQYVEHSLGTFQGREAITKWIVEVMAAYPAMTSWIEWHQIENDHIAFYVWNNLPDPTGEGRHFQFPNSTILRYAGGGQFDEQDDYYNPADAERIFTEWIAAGGRRDTPQDRSLRGIPDWAPAVPEPAFPRDEVESELHLYRERGNQAVASGNWNPWADQFTEDASYLEHHYGRFEGQQAIRDWINGVMQPFPEMVFPITWYSIDGNRVSTRIPNVLPDPTGGDADYSFDVNTILHYAGNGKWSYEEDVYNPREAEQAVAAWVTAGGTLPPGVL
jgi:predicted SnoaL-like aldol condensation-catalyzing enzyme